LELQHGRRLSTTLSRTSAVQSPSACATYLAMLWTSDETYFAHTLGAALIYPAQLAYSISEDRLFGVLSRKILLLIICSMA
jgi:hypothetical protein